MENYETLEKLYYLKKPILEEYEKRFNNCCTYKTDLYIKPIKKGERVEKESFELFYLPINKVQLLQEKIHFNSKEITILFKELPQIASKWCTREIMINEIIKTNKIEGVHTTKKDIYNSMNSKKADRFTGVIKKYQQIINDNVERIETIEEIKNLYTEIFEEDILKNPENKLDGIYFRNQPIYISNGLTNIHTGDKTEKEIISHLMNLLKFMNAEDIPSLLKASITHYYIEYIHPFYDGNGRFGRLLFSMYLARKLDVFTGLSLSYAIFEEKEKYSKLFTQVSNTKNYGEITFFIMGMLEMVMKGQESIIKMLKEKSLKLKYAEDYISKLNLDKTDANILFVYVQHYIFSNLFPLEDRELVEIFGISRHTLNNHLNILVEKGLVYKANKKPSIHNLSEEIIDFLN